MMSDFDFKRHRADEVTRSFERKSYDLSGLITPSSMDLVSSSANNYMSMTDAETSILPLTTGPVVDINHGNTTVVASTEVPRTSVCTSTSIPTVPRQLGSASNSAPLMHMSPNIHNPTSMSLFQGAQNLYLHQPTITMANNIQYVSDADGNEQLRKDRLDPGMTEKVKDRERPSAAPLEVTRTDSVGYEKTMTTKATLHRDGKVVVKVNSSCHDLFHGLRGRVLIVLRNVDGAAIGVTEKMHCTTRGGLLDFLTPSFGDDMFFLEFPRDVAELTVGLDIWQADNDSVGDVLSKILQKAQGAIAIAHLI